MSKYYFSPDGSYGSAYELVIIDTDGLDDHFETQFDNIHENYRSAWAYWFTENNHKFVDNGEDGGVCFYCQNHEDGSLTDIDAKWSEEE